MSGTQHLEEWVAEEGMKGLTSAQRDILIYGELKGLTKRLDRVYTDWFGDPDTANDGHKVQVIANTAFRASIQQGTRGIKLFLGAISAANLGAWIWFINQIPR